MNRRRETEVPLWCFEHLIDTSVYFLNIPFRSTLLKYLSRVVVRAAT